VGEILRGHTWGRYFITRRKENVCMISGQEGGYRIKAQGQSDLQRFPTIEMMDSPLTL
jgi:hypothetical protein